MDRKKYEIVEEDGMQYKQYKIQGKHGLISLHVPLKEHTQEDIDELYRTIAEVMLNTLREKGKEK